MTKSQIMWALFALFIVIAFTFQQRHNENDGLTESARAAGESFDRLANLAFGGRDSDYKSKASITKELKEKDLPIVMLLYGAAVLFLFGALLTSKSNESISEKPNDNPTSN